jgi:hypothetical protein
MVGHEVWNASFLNVPIQSSVDGGLHHGVAVSRMVEAQRPINLDET